MIKNQVLECMSEEEANDQTMSIENVTKKVKALFESAPEPLEGFVMVGFTKENHGTLCMGSIEPYTLMNAAVNLLRYFEYMEDKPDNADINTDTPSPMTHNGVESNATH